MHAVPYDTIYCKRKQAFIYRNQQIKPTSLKIDTEKAVYQKAEDIYDDGCIRFPAGNMSKAGNTTSKVLTNASVL